VYVRQEEAIAMAANLFRVILPVADMRRADAFWSRMLGLAIDPVVPTRHYLRTAGAILALVHPAEHGRAHRPLPDWTYFRVPDLDAAWERARELGCPPSKHDEGEGIAVRAWGDRSFYTYDPFGNPLCFVDDARSESPPEVQKYVGKPIANLCKVILPTQSMGRAEAFFEELLELEADTFVPNRHFFRCDGCELALVNPREHATAHGLAQPEFRPNPELVYFAVPDLDESYERARKLRMRPLADDDVGWGIRRRPWGERSFYGVDPSGNPICFVDEATMFVGSAPR
jgi:catechol 2,3-dioxygenase-like lactoylglutathione lyase family enzyme